MGGMRDDRQRLRSEIGSLRKAREQSIQELRNSAVSLRSAVSEMLAKFSRSHGQIARTAQAERSAFVSRLKRTVAAQRKEFAADLAGARRAWRGKGA